MILNAALASVVLVYAAGDFFKNAWRALKQKKIILDFPIALGIAAMFARSAVDILTGGSPGYFDTFMGLIFFLLIGRYVQSRSYAWLNFERDNLLFLPLAVRVKTATSEKITPVQELRVGDRLRLLAGEIAPVRSKVLIAEAAVDYAFITGESEPVVIPRGAILEAGGKVVGQSIEVEVLEDIDPAKLNRIWEDAGSNAASSSDAEAANAAFTASSFAEKILPYFTGIVLVTATAALVYWLPKDGAHAWNAFSAVLVITCPCALAMAKPFSFFTTQSVLARAGLFLKSTAIVEKFFRLRTIVFDKTGTLTSTGKYDTHFVAQAAAVSESELALFAAVANESTHPLARAVASYRTLSENFIVSDFSEYAGRGLSARCNGRRVVLGSLAWLADNGVAATPPNELSSSAVFAAIDDKYCGYFAIQNTLRSALSQTVAALKKNYAVALLSGDGERERERFVGVFGIGSEPRAGVAVKDSLYFNATPEKKSQIIGSLQAHGPVMMVGDGLNDAAAIAAADLGVALTENHSNFSPASDAILSASAFATLPRLIAMAKQAQYVAIAAYVLSFAYNIFGVSVAVSGELTPLFCAILMPLSSLSVIGLAFLSARVGALMRGLR
ncbi:MAG: HAD-IC family P-type ATPase [Spirochaetes bacterium]|nr:HAD-IC family P-type ATPase [Spirochaetota bacterium]